MGNSFTVERPCTWRLHCISPSRYRGAQPPCPGRIASHSQRGGFLRLIARAFLLDSRCPAKRLWDCMGFFRGRSLCPVTACMVLPAILILSVAVTPILVRKASSDESICSHHNGIENVVTGSVKAGSAVPAVLPQPGLPVTSPLSAPRLRHSYSVLRAVTFRYLAVPSSVSLIRAPPSLPFI